MNTIASMVRDYRPASFLSVDIDRLVLKQALSLSLSEAIILSLLLKEYQVNDFPVRAVRQHIHNLRKKLEERYGNSTIISMGMGFYLISDAIKASIQNDCAGGI